ncbi:MAG: hypothetical protein H6707_13325 [Deltaproteobacteria bacterium]|nr:hypothetical protein [Deltaproteobacteria bacterium]
MQRILACGISLVVAAALGISQPACLESASCTDGKKDGAETDVDCGGPVCGACQVKAACLQPSDCLSGVCTDNACVAASCTDGVKNGSESDVDCGGGDCAGCESGRACAKVSDCASGVCGNNVCQDASCSDKLKNGDETDVDCGGSCSDPCALGKGCRLDQDCTSNLCDSTSKTCLPTVCQNGQRDGSETDVDCGGQDCAPCVDGKTCASADDCQSRRCGNLICTTAACDDGLEDGDETDVDCGGSCPARCAKGAGCAAPSDCATGLACNNNVCCLGNDCSGG